MSYSKTAFGLIFLGFITIGLCVGCVSDGPGSPRTASTPEQKERDATTYVRLGVDYMNKGNFALAEKRFQRAVEIAPKSSFVHWTYAVLQEKLKYPAKAEASYKKAIKLNKDNGDAHNAYGAFLCRQGRISDAISAFDRAISNTLYQGILTSNINAADCLLQNNKISDAKPYVTAALDINEASPKANYLLAKVYYHEGRYAQSSVILNRLSLEARDNPGVLWLCVMTERKLGNRNAEAICTKNLIRRYPSSKEAESI